MAGLTKEQKAAKAKVQRASALEAAGLTEEQFAALSAGEQATVLAPKAQGTVALEDAEGEVEFVQMVRDHEMYPEPHTAQVHPDEVDNYRPGGWTEA